MVTSKAQKRSKKNNKDKRKFISVFLLTILLTRFLIYFIPKFISRTSVIWEDKFHHLFIGLALLLFYFLIKEKKSSFYFLAIALGLILDQLAGAPFYIADMLNKPLAPYLFWYSWSSYNLIATGILIIFSLILINKYKK